MDAAIKDVEQGVGCSAGADNGDTEPSDAGELNTSENSSAHNEDFVIEPRVGIEFNSEGAAKSFYEEYARRVGFSCKVGHKNRKSDGRIIAKDFVCGRDGSKRRSVDSCDAMLRIELKGPDKWIVTKFVKEHSHLMMSPNRVQYIQPYDGTAKTVAESNHCVGVVPSGVMYVSMDGNHASADSTRGVNTIASAESNRSDKSSPSANYVRQFIQRNMLGSNAQNLLEYFKKMQAENPGFFYAIQLDQENRMVNVFWADARSRIAYSHFGDAVTLDTTHRVNQYRVPFAPFTGVNHHGQTILFGCALLFDVSEASFIWLFKTFITAMNDHHPVSITTDQDKAIGLAIAQVFPRVRHCVSRWHVLQEGQDKLAHVCHAYPSFQVDLYNCINLTDTIEEFESSWNCVLDKYDLRRNDWLQSIYNSRDQWVPVYFRDTFFAAISPNQGFDCSLFDGFVNQQTTLPMFFRQYERAIESWFEKETEADFDTICTTPVLKTPSPMEKQAANLYTKRIFEKFQEELVETFVYTANRIEGDGAISTFRVAKFEDDNKAYLVSLSCPELRVNCSCQMFEYSGILCRHVLTVFTVTNVLTLPPHYILTRWTRNSKSGSILDERDCGLHRQESLTSRYNNLCQEAMQFAEGGAVTVDTYNAALSTLKEGGKKVATVKKNVAKVTPPNSQGSGTGYENRSISSMSASDKSTVPILWPLQDEMVRCFNLNDANSPAHHVSDFNIPHTAPLSVHRDEGHSENMVGLPHLKSMTWVMESKNSTPGNRVAVINLKLQDYNKTQSAESEVKFQLSRVTLEPMLRSMAYITEQLSTPATKVAVINLKLQDSETTTGESEVKFQVSRETLGAMLRSMAYIREQLSNAETPPPEPQSKRQRK